MAVRKRVSRGRFRKHFRKSASKSKGLNLMGPLRGGWRL